MRARIHGVTALLVVAVLAAVATSCSESDASDRAAVKTPGSMHDSAERRRDPGGASGMDMGGMDMSGAGHRHDAALPPLAQRLADATAVQRAATASLLARTKATLTAYAAEPAAGAAGFVPVDSTKRVIHYRNLASRRDDRELDPEHPEGLVYLRTGSGDLRLLGALYTVRPGEPAPTPGGAIFFWHTHQPSCGSFLVPAGRCADTFRMLHVWTAPGAPDPWIQPVQLAFGRT